MSQNETQENTQSSSPQQIQNKLQSWLMPKDLTCIQEEDETYDKDRTIINNQVSPQSHLAKEASCDNQKSQNQDFCGSPSPNISFSLDGANFQGSDQRRSSRKTSDLAATINGNNISRITGTNNVTQNFMDDSRIMELLQYEDGEGLYEEIDMGQLDDEEKQYLIVDKDSGKVYDIRNERHLQRISDRSITKINTEPTHGYSSTSDSQILKPKAWSDWWKDKRKNDQDFLASAENGDLEELRKLLDEDKLLDLAADVNVKGLDQWTALHFAANEGRLEIIKELMKYPDVEKEPQSSIQRTPLHIAAIRGHTQILRVLIDNGADKDVKDFDQYTPLHHASEYGHFESIIYLIKEAGADPSLKNKFGYTPSDIAHNIEVRQLFDAILKRKPEDSEDAKSYYGRTAYQGVLRHNDRVTSVQKLMSTYQNVNKFLVNKNSNEEALIQRLCEQEEREKQKNDPSTKNQVVAKKSEKHEKKWKMKFIQIWKYNEKLDRDLEESKGAAENSIGPQNFLPILKLGQGSFGQVYLVDKVLIQKDGSKVNTGKQYAMKILNKKQILGQNLVKYAKTERDVLTYTKHPFIVGLKYAFQTPEKLFLLLDYAPGGNMSKSLHKERRFPEDRARIYLAEIILALEDLHKRDIIFRDLKPDNIVFDSDGHVLLTDFGLAKEGVLSNNQARSFCGSPAYLAPEMIKRSGHGKSVDWYLLGVLFYEMLVGIPPYYSNNKDQLYSNIQTGPLKLPNFLSQEARNLLISLLNRNPSKRLGSCKRDAEEIKEHPFFANFNWTDTMLRKQKVPRPQIKKVLNQDVSLEKVYGRGAFDESLRDHNRLNEWSFIKK